MSEALALALKRVEERYGSRRKAALAMGLSRQRVQNWIRNGRVSGECAVLLEMESGIPRWMLRPDLHPEEPSPSAAPEANRAA
jgi:hypothetical protein